MLIHESVLIEDKLCPPSCTLKAEENYAFQYPKNLQRLDWEALEFRKFSNDQPFSPIEGLNRVTSRDP